MDLGHMDDDETTNRDATWIWKNSRWTSHYNQADTRCREVVISTNLHGKMLLHFAKLKQQTRRFIKLLKKHCNEEFKKALDKQNEMIKNGELQNMDNRRSEKVRPITSISDIFKGHIVIPHEGDMESTARKMVKRLFQKSNFEEISRYYSVIQTRSPLDADSWIYQPPVVGNIIHINLFPRRVINGPKNVLMEL